MAKMMSGLGRSLAQALRAPRIRAPAFQYARLACGRSLHTSAAVTAAAPASPRHFLSIADVSPGELVALVTAAQRAKHAIKGGNSVPSNLLDSLSGKTVAIMFSKRSTRTRISTEGAVVYMGGHPMFLGKEDIQLGVNESLYDTSKVISSMTSCIVARVGQHKDITELAKSSSVPVINALSDAFHPMQAIADMLTIAEARDSQNLAGLKVAWVGDANNVLYDLALACSKFGINVSAATPAGYDVDPSIWKLVEDSCRETGASIETVHEPELAVKNADFIVTDTWVSMGQEEEKLKRLKDFAGFQITNELASRGGAKPDWKFMHCLPRKPEEVSDEVFYSPRSLVFNEAENRLYAAIAALEAFVVDEGNILV
ncbi:ornithine carbamoyltransferase [Orbilia oligospora]|uniref:Ornithine carbamoyltransferase, mitochondrial n=1 Tax=Orbilia oligospora TaxID=2813651 RepID=A0A7C8NIG1_ORBOL|nr:ornithine carbamoyltransferase [Orbilia oligospora]KAF3091058.1 ornithine carbamoyltransferase [Orbilia oligospora]KAF3097871.1 ornithine carbamoyltransferase [Orbilia oligospora]KAF3123427.1 ornithine carbamoyltransferase [Orbilia oligospora]KAF3131143.1 ornithine carbamoyltransferase [Orbilia oligospora]